MVFVSGAYPNAVSQPLNHVGSASTPTLIAIHYTVTDTVAQAVSALNGRGLSYHFLIAPDGTVHQTRRPDVHAAHAGRSNWKMASGLSNGTSLNRSAVSISFINRGFFARKSATSVFDVDAHNNVINWTYPLSASQTTASVYDPGSLRHWHRYTAEQLAAVHGLVRALRDDYGLTEIVGHDDIAIDGKSDPGPLFPMADWRAEFGMQGGPGMRVRVQSADGTLNVRRRPSAGGALVTTLQNGDTLFIRAAAYTYRTSGALFVDSPDQRYLTGWASVDLDGSNTHAGFVHMKHLSDNPLSAALAARL